MANAPRQATPPHDLLALRSDTAWHLAGGFVLTLTIALLLGFAMRAPLISAGLSALLYLAVAALVWWELPWHLPQRRFGNANRVTLLRAAAILTLAGLLLAPRTIEANPWWPCALATAALLLDGLDGWLARRHKVESRFGAWFDQELDGFFILVLSLMAWVGGQAGPWVLLLGAYRYLFLLAGSASPRFRRPLRFSKRRRFACAFTVAVLIACLLPFLDAKATTGLAAAALALLSYSFAVDIFWLMKQGDARV